MELVDPNSTLLGLPSSTEALSFNKSSFPSVQPGDEVTTVEVAEVNADQEDPFSLEPFSDLIQAHIDAGKDFILARVLTVEEKDDTKRFYTNYYQAHVLNRQLFRTQPSEGLLHRLKAKNPMNNLPIVGDVHYYVVRASDYAKSKKDSNLAAFDESIDKSTKMAVSRTQSISGEARRMSDSALSLSIRNTEMKPLRRLSAGNEPAESDHISVEVRETQPEKATSDEPQTFTARLYATDDDYLMKRFVREYFKKNALNVEDIFLFTLFGASQHTGEAFSSPFVSDPTNPAAVALPIEQAVSSYLRSQDSTDQEETEGLIDGRVRSSVGQESFWSRLRFDFRPRQRVVSTEAGLTPNADVEGGFSLCDPSSWLQYLKNRHRDLIILLCLAIGTFLLVMMQITNERTQLIIYGALMLVTVLLSIGAVCYHASGLQQQPR